MNLQGNTQLRIVAWEVTRSCNLNCVHCRASAARGRYPNELSTSKIKEILDQITEVGRPIVILTGGEPLLRKDIYELASYGTEKELRMALATNGTLVNDEIADKIKESGIKRVSISIDGANRESHDNFRQVKGAFDRALKGIFSLKKRGVEFQLNTTITRHNLPEIKDILGLAIKVGAAAHHIFLLVPTGRAKEMKDQELNARQYEETLYWFYQQEGQVPLQLKATCAPQYYRIKRQAADTKDEMHVFNDYGMNASTRGCLAGVAYCFISNEGIVQPCGYLELNSGDLSRDTFSNIWRNSEIFHDLRDFNKYKGKCGRCEYVEVCGGCRARAFAASGDYLSEEPLCAYNPPRVKGWHGSQ